VTSTKYNVPCTFTCTPPTDDKGVWTISPENPSTIPPDPTFKVVWTGNTVG
jgi:hypothetical protein